MKILILGGTVFLGRHLVEYALARGHTVTLFNRGRHNPGIFPQVERIQGAREGDLAGLAGRRWDTVIDTSGNLPRDVKAAAERLINAVEHYTLISTVFAYADYPRLPGLKENAPLHQTGDPAAERVTWQTVGPLKALCERTVRSAFSGRQLIVRAGMIVGPYDPSGRSAYWPRRIARGGDVLLPGVPDCRVQFIDARDLAAWVVGAVENRLTGAYNATGPAYVLTIQRLLESYQAETRIDAIFVPVPDQFLLAAGVRPMDIPFWMPGQPGAAAMDCSKAIGAGIRFRDIAETVRDTLAWHTANPDAPSPRSEFSVERELELLRKWRSGSLSTKQVLEGAI